MSTSGSDSPQQKAFLTSASSGLANITSIDNGSSSALPTQTAIQDTRAPPGAGASNTIVTGLTAGDVIGIAISSAAVLAIFLWWFWPKRHRSKKNPDIPTSFTKDIKQTSVTTEVKKTDERHLSARAKTF